MKQGFNDWFKMFKSNYKMITLFNALLFVVSLFTISILPIYLLSLLTLEVEVMIWFQFVQSFNFVGQFTYSFLQIKIRILSQSANHSVVFRSMCIGLYYSHVYHFYFYSLIWRFSQFLTQKQKVKPENCGIAKNMSDRNLRPHYRQTSTSVVTIIIVLVNTLISYQL